MRESGILLPVSALPSKHGIGTLGKAAYDFIYFLVKSGTRCWQILPIGPTGYGDSPYQSFSAFAGNPYFIDLDMLADEGLLTRAEIKKAGFLNDPDLIDYGDLYEKRFPLLRKAAFRVSPVDPGFLAFARENPWLSDYALFMAIKAERGMVSFQLWPEKTRRRDEKTIKKAKERLKGEIHFFSALQYLFFKQWSLLKNYANENGIKIIGDIPIYVSPDSADLWAGYKLFQANVKRRLKRVAGCPPDYFNEKGQRWGNPLYNWNYHKKDGYGWWIERLRFAGKIFDVVRIDHFRGFASYYSIPAENETAEFGEWKKGPGKKFIAAVKKSVPGLAIIAEDLGILTNDARRLLKVSGFPGMKVLQFAFDSSEESDYLPHKYPRNCVVYTGTHDNTTTAGWVKKAALHEIEFVKRYLAAGGKANLTYELIKAAMNSKSDLCVIPMQDWLGLGDEARINTPGTPEGNFRFRVRKNKLSEYLAQNIRHLTLKSGRN